jgi:hypothetical protein
MGLGRDMAAAGLDVFIDTVRAACERSHRAQIWAVFSAPQYGHRMLNSPDVTVTYVRKDNVVLQWFNSIEERVAICHVSDAQSLGRLSWLISGQGMAPDGTADLARKESADQKPAARRWMPGNMAAGKRHDSA